MAKKKVRSIVVPRKERKKKAKHRTRAIVVGHLEKIGSGVFERYQEHAGWE